MMQTLQQLSASRWLCRRQPAPCDQDPRWSRPSHRKFSPNVLHPLTHSRRAMGIQGTSNHVPFIDNN